MPWIVTPVAPVSRIPLLVKRLMMKPLMVLLEALASRENPDLEAPAEVPFNSMIGAAVQPVCEVPSRMTVSVIVGKALLRLMVCKPVLIVKVIVSVPAVVLASVIA